MIFILLAAAIAAGCIGMLLSAPLKTTEYTLRGNVSRPLRILQLTDLHSNRIGKDNARLLAAAAKAQPDLIFITGDMLSRSDTNADVVCALIPELVKIAPVYYSFGNHEVYWEEHHPENLTRMIEQSGAVVLKDTYLDVEVKGQSLRIGGCSDYFLPQAWETDFMDTARQKLLLCHIPTPWLDWGGIHTYDAGVVFSGHYHGGQLRFPFLNQGLYAPGIGILPPYTKGLYEGEQSACILSTGLGTERSLPRFFNPLEICVMELLPKDGTEASMR